MTVLGLTLACALTGCVETLVGGDRLAEDDEATVVESPDNEDATGSGGPASSGSTEQTGFAGLCALAQHGYYHLVAHKFASDVGATYFDVIRGDAYVRDLDICIGVLAGQGGSWVLPANVESDAGEIYQLGYGRAAGRGGNYFVYALGSPAAIEINGVTPMSGHRYRFEISKRATYNTVSFKITDLSTTPSTVVWSMDSTTPWSGTMNHAWWGYETWDSFSTHGVPSGRSGVNMAYMGYSSNLDARLFYRSDLECTDIWKNFTWDGSSTNNGCDGERRGELGNWIYGGDKFDAISY